LGASVLRASRKPPAEQRADEADAYWRPSWRRDETVWFSTTAVPIKAEARKTAKLRSAWTASLLPVDRDA